jgi:hypothetical protein
MYTIEQKKNIINESIGEKYGKLIVIRFIEYRKTPNSSKVPMVECQCDCGNKKVVSLWDVRSGKTKTCGLNHPHYEDRSIPAFNLIYNHSYKKRAIKTGLEFNISKDEFRQLTQEKCHYCGTKPNNISYRGKRGTYKTGKYLSQYVYNGLDRIDSSKGYTLDNVVPCCGICNHAKHTMSYEEFIIWLHSIVQHQIKKGGTCPPKSPT